MSTSAAAAAATSAPTVAAPVASATVMSVSFVSGGKHRGDLRREVVRRATTTARSRGTAATQQTLHNRDGEGKRFAAARRGAQHDIADAFHVHGEVHDVRYYGALHREELERAAETRRQRGQDLRRYAGRRLPVRAVLKVHYRQVFVWTRRHGGLRRVVGKGQPSGCGY